MTEFTYVPTSAIICMAAEAFFAVAFPVAALIFWKKKSKASLFPVLIGALTFIVFAQVLEGVAHALCLQIITPVADFINSSTVIYAVYGGLMAGLFEETGRLVSFKFFLKKYRDKNDAVSYGLGHGGIECVLVLGVNMVVYSVLALLINSGFDTSVLAAQTGGDISALATLIDSVAAITPAASLLAVFERVCAMALHLCLSMVVFWGVKKAKASYYIIAVLLHAVFDTGIILVSSYLGIYAAEAVLGIFVAAFAFYVFKIKKGEL